MGPVGFRAIRIPFVEGTLLLGPCPRAAFRVEGGVLDGEGDGDVTGISVVLLRFG